MLPLLRELPDVEKTRREMRAKQRKRYAPYGLERNPFPLGGNFPGGYLQYTYLTHDQEATINDFLLSTFSRAEFNGLLILGEYGTGKSHLLNYIHEMVNADTLQVFGGCAVSFLIQNPSVAPEDILLSLLRTIKLGTLQDLIYLPIRRELHKRYSDNPLSFLDHFTNFARQLSLTPGALQTQEYKPDLCRRLFSIAYPEFRQTLAKQNLILKPKEIVPFSQRVLLGQVTDNLLIVESLVGLLFGDEARDARSWESFLVSTLIGRRGQVVGVEHYLGAVLRLFEIMGISHVYLLVDELEDLRTQRLSKKAATEYLAALRRMIQHNHAKFSFVLASTRDAWGELKILYPAIEDRFPVVVDLVRTPEVTKEVVAKYLEVVRADEPVQNSWFPFSETAIDRLIEMRGNVLRHVITACRKLIDVATDEGVAPPLDQAFVEQNLS